MRNVVEILDELQIRAGKDPDLRKQLLGTRLESDPVSAFCRTCRGMGYELYEMELMPVVKNFTRQ